jgi:hypothetical protein
MDLGLLTEGTPNQKPWLNITANTVTTNLVTSGSFVGPMTSNTLTLVNQGVAPPNPAVGSVTLYSDGTGIINTVDSMGVTNPYCRITGFQMVGNIDMNANDLQNVQLIGGPTHTRLADNIVSNSIGGTVGSLPMYHDTTGKIIDDSGVQANNLFLADGSVSATGDFNMLGHGINAVSNVFANEQVYVNNLGVSWSNFMQFSQVTVNNTAALTSLSTGAGSIGSLTFPVSNKGQWMEITGTFQATSTLAPTLNFVVIVNLASEATVTISPPNALTHGSFKAILSFGATFCNVYLEVVQSGQTLVSNFARPAIVPASSNTFDMAVQWSAADASNNIGCTSLAMVTHGYTSNSPPLPEFKLPQPEMKDATIHMDSTPLPKVVPKELFTQSLPHTNEAGWEEIDSDSRK